MNMKSSVSNPSVMNTQVLPDGTVVKEQHQTRTLPDGTLVSKLRTSRTYNDHPSLKKSITASITRTDASGVVTTTTTEEVITANTNSNDTEFETGTHTQILEDGTTLITTKNCNVLSDESLSRVVTMVHVDRRGGGNGEVALSSAVAIPPVASVNSNRPQMHIIPCDEPQAPPGYTNHTGIDYDSRIKRKEEQNRRITSQKNTMPHLESISNDDHSPNPTVPGVEMVKGPAQGKTSKAEASDIQRSTCRMETINNAEEPIPKPTGAMHINGPPSGSKRNAKVSANAIETVGSKYEEPKPLAGSQHVKEPPSDKSKLKSSVVTLETIGDYEEPMPSNAPFVVSPHVRVSSSDEYMETKSSGIISLEMFNGGHDEPVPFHSTERSKLLNEVADVEQQNFDQLLEEIPHEKDKNEKETTRSGGRFRSDDYFSESTADLAVATPVLDEVEKPIYDATEYEAKTPFYKTRKCALLTLILLLIVSIVVGVVVWHFTKKAKEQVVIPVEYVTEPPTSTPTLSPTSGREVLMSQIVENTVLQRNASFNDMATNDPRRIALDWLLHTDEMKLTPSDPNLNQRYTLAVIAYALDYNVWYNDPMTDNSTLNETLDGGDDATANVEVIDWLSGTDVCEWYGVNCTNGVVTEIDLSYNQLIGKIPPEIGNLHSLEKLVLSFNCLYGTLPPEVGMLSNLQHFDILSNGLSGIVPIEFFQLSLLSYIDLSWQSNTYDNCTTSDGNVVEPLYKMGEPDNGWNYGLEGEFFKNVGPLQNIVHIDIEWNYFTGSISHDIKNLQNLEYLNGGGNWFNGTIPSEIGTLSKLRKFEMHQNTFSGPFPENIGDAKALEVIALWVNENGRMNGTLPDSFYSLTKLTSLSLSGQNFTGEIKTEIGSMENLTSFKISRNEFTGTLPSELGLCEKLEWIQIHDNDIGGSAPPEVCALRGKNLNPAYTGQPVFQADCAPENGVAFFECDNDCCTTCCAHSTKICSSTN